MHGLAAVLILHESANREQSVSSITPPAGGDSSAVPSPGMWPRQHRARPCKKCKDRAPTALEREEKNTDSIRWVIRLLAAVFDSVIPSASRRAQRWREAPRRPALSEVEGNLLFQWWATKFPAAKAADYRPFG